MWSLLAWATVTLTDTVNHVRFSLNGDPAVIFGNTISTTNFVRAAFMTPYQQCTPGGSDNYMIDDYMTASPVFGQAYNGRYDTAKSFWFLQIATAVDKATNTLSSPCPDVFSFDDYGFQVQAKQSLIQHATEPTSRNLLSVTCLSSFTRGQQIL